MKNETRSYIGVLLYCEATISVAGTELGQTDQHPPSQQSGEREGRNDVYPSKSLHGFAEQVKGGSIHHKRVTEQAEMRSIL